MKYGHFILGAALVGGASPAFAQSKPIAIGDGVTLQPIIDARLRYEAVDRDKPLTDADAVTLRLRSGFELKSGPFAFLAEAEGTLGIDNDYNDTNAGNGVEPFAIVADPENVELNRLQLQYKTKAFTATVGRQRINLDDQRFVGAVGWRQNEQTFDAVRGEATIGPVSLDGTYAISQRTIFGVDAGPRQAFDGDFIFLGAGVKAGPITIKAFGYLLDFDETIQFANSSKTFGARAVGAIPLGGKAKLNVAASYARQKDYGDNPFNYSADYIAGELGSTVAGFSIAAGYEKLGSGTGRAFQTPMATLHKFNGWADIFLTTPAAGLQDYYATIAYKFDVKALPGLNAGITYHRFDSDAGDLRYGDEWNASIGFKVRKVGVLVKYADYDARRFSVDTQKLWLQLEWAY